MPVGSRLRATQGINPPFDAIRTDRQILAVLEPILGPNIISVVSTLFWKPPGEARTATAYDQDAAFRKPKERFRRLGQSYAQLGLALDPQGPSNGGLRIVVGSHKRGDLSIRRETRVMLESRRRQNWRPSASVPREPETVAVANIALSSNLRACATALFQRCNGFRPGLGKRPVLRDKLAVQPLQEIRLQNELFLACLLRNLAAYASYWP